MFSDVVVIHGCNRAIFIGKGLAIFRITNPSNALHGLLFGITQFLVVQFCLLRERNLSGLR